ncbi:MAG: type I 3-dehydroquinate dehydratase [Desulfurivibrio sp.]|nr:MAG: type I 3-dehydroquinate dehydratase [Desulfurivibrio sp.]
MPHKLKGAAPGLLCVAIARPDTGAAIQAARQAQAFADVIEIRLDSLAEPAIAPFLQAIATPLLFTNRPRWEGGQGDGPEEKRLALLLQAVQAGAAYVDIELNSEQAAVQGLCAAARQQGGTQVIVSWHNFSETPGVAALTDIFSRQRSSGAQIGKIVTMAHDFTDVLRVLQLQEEAHRHGFPLIAFCMGRAGMISRLATLELGGFMTYAALNADEATAPGQLAALELLNCLKSFGHAD